jgi:transcriptional regulator with XRE-family HTH domain
MNTIGPFLKQLRLQQGLQRKVVAQQVGVSSQFLSHIEHGFVVPSDTRLRQLAEVLGGGDFDYFSLLAGRVPADVLARLQEDPELLITIRAAHSR